LRAERRVENELPVPLERRQQHRDQRLQSLGADPVGRLPEDDQRLQDLSAVSMRPSLAPNRVLSSAAQCSDSVFAVIAGNRHELIKDASLL
jgi:hypothetical protein